jgi:hypothetical protein
MINNQIVRTRADRQEYWKQKLEAFSRSGKSLQAFCRDQDLNYSSICTWKRRLGFSKTRKASEVVSIPVLSGPSRHGPLATRIRIEGIELEFLSRVEPEWIAAVVSALGASRRAGRC